LNARQPAPGHGPAANLKRFAPSSRNAAWNVENTVGIVDFILNLAGLLLWVNWRAAAFDPLSRAVPATLAGTLRRAEPQRTRPWHFLAGIVALLTVRAFFYAHLAPALEWTPRLDLVATQLAFPSDVRLFRHTLGWMTLYSALSFGLTLAVFFLWLLLFSLVAAARPDSFFLVRLQRVHLGRLERWPIWARALLPLAAGALGWFAMSWPLAALGLLPPPASWWTRLGQSALIGLSAYTAWKYPLAVLLGLHLLGSYVYFGPHPIWNYSHEAARRLLRPLAGLPLRVAKMDLSPVVGLALVFLFARLMEEGLPLGAGYRLPGLADLFRLTTR
jgi:uncharacterized protein YggT (Ycf19 family)